jgi:hypothetical protein
VLWSLELGWAWKNEQSQSSTLHVLGVEGGFGSIVVRECMRAQSIWVYALNNEYIDTPPLTTK